MAGVEMSKSRQVYLVLRERIASGGLSSGDALPPEQSLAAEHSVSRITVRRALAELERALNETGYLKRGSDGQLKLSPKAMRQLGKALLKDVANRMSGRQGQRDMRHAGAAGEMSGASREWTFGDTEPWNVTKTITNAVVRTASSGTIPSPTAESATAAPAKSASSAGKRSSSRSV